MVMCEYQQGEEAQFSAAPRLKDADIPATSWSRLYIELLVMIRKIYQHCKLVHGDLSEYNILWVCSCAGPDSDIIRTAYISSMSPNRSSTTTPNHSTFCERTCPMPEISLRNERKLSAFAELGISSSMKTSGSARLKRWDLKEKAS